MIRISVEKMKKHTIVTIDGRLTASDLQELRRVRNSVAGIMVLSLSGLDCSLDAGIQVLKEWLGAGARLQDATPYLRMILENGAPSS